MEYINKAAIVAEIERRRRDWHYGSSTEAKFKREECDDILSFLDTLEVKEVDEEYNGKAMLHVLEKGVKQGKREAINRACEWLNDNLHHYWGSISADPHNFLFDFRKAMEE